MKKILFLITICFLFLASYIKAAPAPDYLEYALKVANNEVFHRNLSTSQRLKWNYEISLLCDAYLKLYEVTQTDEYYEQILEITDKLINTQGLIETYNQEEFDLRNIYGGNYLFDLYRYQRNNKYLNAMILLRKQLHKQPRIQERVFWFSQSHPNEVGLKGMYMVMPFYCLYASLYDEPKIFNDIVLQFTIIDELTLDISTGLNYQAWDEDKTHSWSDKTTGTTTALFGQGIGYYIMAIVDVLDYFPVDNPYRQELIRKLNRICKSLIKYQDKSGMWYQVVDIPKDKRNFQESSATAMYTYTIAKGVNKGYLPKKYRQAAEKAFKALISNCYEDQGNNTAVITRATNEVNLDEGNGTAAFYFNLLTNNQDLKANAFFILAAIELAK